MLLFSYHAGTQTGCGCFNPSQVLQAHTVCSFSPHGSNTTLLVPDVKLKRFLGDHLYGFISKTKSITTAGGGLGGPHSEMKGGGGITEMKSFPKVKQEQPTYAHREEHSASTSRIQLYNIFTALGLPVYT